MGILDRIAGKLDELVGGQEQETQRHGDDGAQPGDRAAARDRDLAHDDLRQGRDLAVLGDHEAAAAALGRAVDADPDDAEAWLDLGAALGQLDRFEPARDAFRRALTLSLPPPLRARAQAGLGGLYAGVGQWGRALRELRRAAEALPDDATVHATLGRVLLSAGDPEGADWLARAGRLPGGGVALLVEAAAAKTEPAAAFRLLHEAEARAPDDPGVRAALALRLLENGDLTGALRAASAATAGADSDAVAWKALRRVHVTAADYPAALADARREAALGAPPPFADWLSMALGAEDRASVEEAITHGQPRDAGWNDARAWLAGTLALDRLAELVERGPGDGARRFVARALAPPAVPAGNLYALLGWAEAFAGRRPALLPLAPSMARAVEAFDRPLLVAVMGEFNTGKSSFVNALAGEPMVPVGVTPTTATINVLRHGTSGGRAIYQDGTARDLAPGTVAEFLGRLDDEAAARVRQVEIFAPIDNLRRVEIVDTPGLNSLRAAHERVARDFLVEADAIIWLLAVDQAAKATERDALALAHAAGKRVLAVVNKVDRADDDQVRQVVKHVETELGPLVGGVLPLSARNALDARRRHDAAALNASGLTALERQLETTFFGHARELKRATALAVLHRFLGEARAAVPAPPSAHREIAAEADALARMETELRSQLAAERVALRARLEQGIRTAAFEVQRFIRPRAWPFGETSADPEDERFLCDLLDDGVYGATERTRAALSAVLAGGGAPSQPSGSDSSSGRSPEESSPRSSSGARFAAALDGVVERFRAYARGVNEGAAAVFFRVDLAGTRADAAAIHRALARFAPEPEEGLFRPLEKELSGFLAEARAELDARRQAADVAALIHDEHLTRPLDALAAELLDQVVPDR